MNNSVVTIFTPTGQPRTTIRLGSGSVRTRTLDGTDEVVIKDSVNARLDLHIGDYVTLDEGRFVLCELQTPTVNESNGALDYSLRFEAPYHLWKNHIFKLNPTIGATEVSWTLTATLKEHMTVFLKNLEMLHQQESAAGFSHYNYRYDDGSAGGLKYAFSIVGNGKTPVTTAGGSIVDTLEAKVISYNNVSLFDALTMIAEAWEFEWWVEDGTIYFGRCESGESVILTEGDNVALMKPVTSKSDYATRIYGFGGTQNISGKYRKHLVFDATNVTSEGVWDAARPIDNTFLTGVEIGSALTPANIVFSDYNDTPSSVTPTESGGWQVCSVAFTRGAERCYLGGSGEVLITVKGSYKLEMDMTVKVESQSTLSDMTIACMNKSRAEVSKATISGETNVSLKSTTPFQSGDSLAWAFEVGFAIDQYVDPYVTISYKINKLRYVSVDIYPDVSVTITKDGSTSNATLHAGDDNVYRFVGGGLSLGDKFTISSPNINEAFIPTSYYSSSNTDENVLRGLAEKRLLLPSEHPYVDVTQDMTPAEVVELAVVVDSIYPKQDLVVTLEGVEDPVYSSTTYDTDESGNKTPRVETYYRFRTNVKGTSTPFMLPSKAVIADEFMVKFTSGKLAGMTFKCYIKEGEYYEVIQSEDYGTPLPNGDLNPQAGDGVIFLGWDTAYWSGTDLDEIAENELYSYIVQYAREIVLDGNDYDCTLHVDYAQTHSYGLGRKVTLKSPFYFSADGRDSRIIGFTHPLDLPYDNPVYTVGESGKTSRLGEMEKQLEGLAYTLSEVQNGGVTTSVVGGRSIVIIRMGSTITPSDENVFSALRALNMFLRKDTADTALGRITFNAGLSSNGTVEVNNTLSAHDVAVTGNTSTTTLTVTDKVTGDLNVEDDVNATNVNADGNVNASNVYAENTIHGKDVEAERSVEIGDWDEGSALGGGGGRIWVDENNISHATFDVLDVRQQMHVTELIIERAKSVGGTLVVSPANMEVGSVEWLSAETGGVVLEQTEANRGLVKAFKCYFVNTDGETTITNEWDVDDQAFCRTWNIREGVTHNFRNKYYWRLVTEVGEDYIVLSNDPTNPTGADSITRGSDFIKVTKPEGNPNGKGYYEKDGDAYTLTSDTSVNPSHTYYTRLDNESTWPSEGDYISVLGNQDSSKKSRQNAIVISAYGDNSPYEYDYQGIDHYAFPQPIYQKYYDPSARDGAGAFIVRIGGEHDYVQWDGAQLTVVGDLNMSSGGSVSSAINTLTQQVGTLGENIDSITGQDGNTFQIWFGDEIPTAYNYPAVDWTTDELKALHDQDIYYSRALGGRAWRYTYNLASPLTVTSYDGTSTTYAAGFTGWVEITDQFTLQALGEAAAARQAVDNLADDGILSAGSEKAQLLISWNDVMSTYSQYPPQAFDFIEWLDTPIASETGNTYAQLKSDLSAAKTAFESAVANLGKFLNGDSNLDLTGLSPTPLYLNNTWFSIDTILADYGQTAAGYRSVWNTYYATLNALLKLITDAAKMRASYAQSTAERALATVEEIAEDGVLEVNEIPSLRREFESAYRERAQMVDLTTYDQEHTIINGVLTTPLNAYLSAFKAVANYLNKGVTWTEPATYAVTSTTWNVAAKTPLTDTVESSDFPALLKEGSVTTKFQADWSNPTEDGDGGVAFRNLWAALNEKKVALANTMSELAKDTADGAQEDIDDMGDDTKITPMEKVALKREFLCYWHEMFDTNGVVDKAKDDKAEDGEELWIESPIAYITAFEALGTYINGSEGSELNSEWVAVGRNQDQTLSAPTTIADYNLPAALNTYIDDITIVSASTYRSKWETFFSERTKLISALITHAQSSADDAYDRADEAYDKAEEAYNKAVEAATGVSEATLSEMVNDAVNRLGMRCKVYTTVYGSSGWLSELANSNGGYKVGDLWINVDTENTAVGIWNPDKQGGEGIENTKLAGETLVCRAVKTGSNGYATSFNWEDWQILDHYVNQWIKSSIEGIDIGQQASTAVESYFANLSINWGQIKLLAEHVEIDENGNITNVDQSGLVTESDFATLFSQEVDTQGIASRSFVTATANAIVLRVDEYSDAEDNILRDPAFKNAINTTNSIWTKEYSSGDRNYAINDIQKVGIYEGVQCVRLRLWQTNDRYSETNINASTNCSLVQSLDYALLQDYKNKVMTLSVYVRNDPDFNINDVQGVTASRNGQFGIFFSDEATDITASSEVGAVRDASGDGYIQWLIQDSNWHRLWVTFRYPDNPQAHNIKFRAYKSYTNGKYVLNCFQLCRPKLEASATPTPWVEQKNFEGKMKSTGIDIASGKIRLDADNVEVAKDLTIGGNTRVGGFVYNLQKKVENYYTFANPYTYGCLDKYILTYNGGVSTYETDNILFPECGSSLIFDASSYEGTAIKYVNLPFYYPFVQHNCSGSDKVSKYPVITDLPDYTSGYSATAQYPEITSMEDYQADTTAYKNTCRYFLIRQMMNARDICRRYLGSTVTIENVNENDGLDIVVFGVKGIVYRDTVKTSDGSYQQWMEYEPWNRNTIVWSFQDYNERTSQTADLLWHSSAYREPSEAEAKMLIEMMRNVCVPPEGLATGWFNETRRIYAMQQGSSFINDRIWVNAKRVVENTNVFCTAIPSEGISMGNYIVPFTVPKQHFCRLKLVYENGYFFWVIEAFGQI